MYLRNLPRRESDESFTKSHLHVSSNYAFIKCARRLELINRRGKQELRQRSYDEDSLSYSFNSEAIIRAGTRKPC